MTLKIGLLTIFEKVQNPNGRQRIKIPMNTKNIEVNQHKEKFTAFTACSHEAVNIKA